MIRRAIRDHGELVLVFGLGLLAQLEIWLDDTWREGRGGLALVALAMTAVLLLRLRAPLPVLAAEIALLSVATVVNPVNDNDPIGLVLFVMVALYTAGAHLRDRALLASLPLVALALVLAIAADGESWNVSGVLFFGFWIAGPFLAGMAMRVRRERERLLARERDERARLAVADERTRIARELHDVVAHAISVIVLQARGARASLTTRPRRRPRGARRDRARPPRRRSREMRRLLACCARDEDATLAPAAVARPARRAGGRGARGRPAGGAPRGGTAAAARPRPGRLRLPHRAGGADQRAQARRPRPRDGRSSRYGADALSSRWPTTGAGGARRTAARAATG